LLSVLLWGTRILGPVDGSTDAWPERREVLYLIGSVAAAVGLFEHLGFLFTMTLFLALTMRVLRKINWPKSIVLALVGSVAAYVVFGRL
jgi:preprotein translocase subunit SecE